MNKIQYREYLNKLGYHCMSSKAAKKLIQLGRPRLVFLFYSHESQISEVLKYCNGKSVYFSFKLS